MEAGAAAEVVGAAVGPTVASPAQAGTGQPLDFELPLTAVVRILKRKLPDGVAVSKEAKVAFAKSAGLFILYLTAAANEYCKDARRSSMSARDIFEALRALQFDELIPPLERFLEETREQLASVAPPSKRSKLKGEGTEAGGAVAVAKRGRPQGSGRKKAGAVEPASESAAATATSPSISPAPSPVPALKEGEEEEEEAAEEDEEVEQEEENAGAGAEEEEEEEEEEETGAAAERNEEDDKTKNEGGDADDSH